MVAWFGLNVWFGLHMALKIKCVGLGGCKTWLDS